MKSNLSKLEKYLQPRLTKLHRDITFHFNQRDAIDDELDIYIPELRLAFEINGVFHYKTFGAQYKLDRTRLVDQRKVDKCHAACIKLHVLNTYKKRKKPDYYLRYISNIIHKRLH